LSKASRSARGANSCLDEIALQPRCTRRGAGDFPTYLKACDVLKSSAEVIRGRPVLSIADKVMILEVGAISCFLLCGCSHVIMLATFVLRR